MQCQGDILLLDVEMEEMDGLAVKELLGKGQVHPRILFISGHPEAMADAFGKDVYGFLRKPIEYDKFAEKMQKMVAEIEKENRCIFLAGSIQSKAVRESDIVYIEAQKKYVNLYMSGEGSLFCMDFVVAPVSVAISIVQRQCGYVCLERYGELIKEIILSIILVLIVGFVYHSKICKDVIQELSTLTYIVGGILGFCASGFRIFAFSYGEEMPVLVKNVFEIMTVCFMEFIALFGISLILLKKLNKQYRRECVLKSECMDSAKQYYQSLQDNMREIRKIRHDMNKHLELLHDMLKANMINDAVVYLEKMTEKMEKTSVSAINMGNEFVNAVLSNEKMKMAEDIDFVCEGRIQSKVNVEHFSVNKSMPEEFLSDYEWCTVLANLVSNAREACERVQNCKKEIYLKIGQNKGHLVIVVENPVEWEIDVKHLGGVYYKTKQ